MEQLIRQIEALLAATEPGQAKNNAIKRLKAIIEREEAKGTKPTAPAPGASGSASSRTPKKESNACNSSSQDSARSETQSSEQANADLPPIPAQWKRVARLSSVEEDWIRANLAEQQRYGTLVPDSRGPDYAPDNCLQSLGTGVRPNAATKAMTTQTSAELKKAAVMRRRELQKERQRTISEEQKQSKALLQEIERERLQAKRKEEEQVRQMREELDRQVKMQRF